MTVTIRDNSTYGPQLAVADVIAGYGNSQGAQHVWTDAEWAQAQATGKVLWLIVFWGHAAVDAIAQAKARKCRGVFYDVEGQYTQQAIASGQPQAFGDACTAAGFPAAPYGTDTLCDAVQGHYGGAAWRYRFAAPSSVAPKTAYQYIHQQGYDESIADDWFRGARPMSYVVVGDGTAPDPVGPGAEYVTDGITKRWIASVAESSALLQLFGQAAIVKMDQGALNEVPLWNANAPAPPPTGTVTVTGSSLKVAGP